MARLVLVCLALVPAAACRPQDDSLRPPSPGRTIRTPLVPPRSDACSESARLKEVSGEGGRRDVWIELDGAWTNLTRFAGRHHVYDYGLSPNGKWVFVWHMKAPPRVVSVYDASSLQLVASFSPGFGGMMLWTSGNTLYHWWGAGTDCRCYALYDPLGRRILTGTTNYVEVSPSRRFLATFPTVGVSTESIRIFDFCTLETVCERRPADLVSVMDATWKSRNSLELRYVAADESRKILSLELE